MVATYILPIRLHSAGAIAEIAAYLGTLPPLQVIVVDGSSEELFARMHDAIGDFALHVKPSVSGLNGKARGVLTGLVLACEEKIVVADDDVRYDASSLRATLRGLDVADVVRPQNYFTPAPWHAVWDSARSLINRAFDGDWPGTLAFRRSALPHGYNANVLFENYELVRTVRAAGGEELIAREIFVARRPPTLKHFIGQRVRQAYDEFARPQRMLVELALLPALLAAWIAKGTPALLVFVVAAMILAACGWLRDGAHMYFSPFSIVAAPLWVLERAICSWLALWQRLRFGGIRYGGAILAAAASTQGERKQWAS